MPKTFNPHEREAIKTAMHNTVLTLMKKKNIRQITVDDIAKGANIAKGSFYSFYKTREEFLWDTIKTEERIMLDEIEQILSEDMIDRPATARRMFNAYLKKDDIKFYVSDKDFEYIFRKLPPERLNEDRQNWENAYAMILSHFGHEPSMMNIEVLCSIIAAVQYAAGTDIPSSDEVRGRVLEVFRDFFAGYLGKGGI